MLKYILLFCLTGLVYADHKPIVNSPIIEGDTTTETVNNTDNSTYNSSINNHYTVNTSGMALGIAASQHNFTASTYSWQASVGIGSYNGSHAASIGIGKRACKKCGLFNGSIGIEKDKVGFGFGYSWKR